MFFKMTKNDTLFTIQELIDKTKRMSRGEFMKREANLGINKLDFNPKDYIEKEIKWNQ